MATKGKSLKQIVQLPGTPKQIYELLMTTQGHSAVTGHRARISGKVGGLCNAFDGSIQARNVALEPGLMIVQAWRFATWAEGWWSTVTIDLATAPKGGTKLRFHQTGIPADQLAALKKGWPESYWEPLKAHLEKKK